MTAIRRELEQLIGSRGTVTPEAIARAEKRVVELGRSLEALTAFTDVLLSSYHRGRMPEQARELFRATVVRLHRDAAAEVNVTPAFVRLSEAQIEKVLGRTNALVARHEATIKTLSAGFDQTVAEIDQLERGAAANVQHKKTQLGNTAAAKNRSQTASVFSGIAGLVPGLKLAKLAMFIPGAAPFALAAIGFGGYKAYKAWEQSESLSQEINVIGGQVAASEQQLTALKNARRIFDDNIRVLQEGLGTLKKIEAEYRTVPVEEAAMLTSADHLAGLARRLRRTEALAYNLKQQIGVWSAMNEHADGLRDQFKQLVGALQAEVVEVDRAAKEAEAEFLTSVVTTVLGAAKIKGVAASAIKETVLLLQIGPEVTAIEKVRRVLEHLGIAEHKHQALAASADEIIKTIDKLTTDRAQILDPAFDKKVAQLSEPQRFLIDVALSGLNTKIDPGFLISVAREVEVSDEEARRIAALIARKSSTRVEVSSAVREVVVAGQIRGLSAAFQNEDRSH
jgi:hypothetical protein